MQLPQQLLNSLLQHHKINVEEFIEAHKAENKITSVRINPFKPTELLFNLTTKIKWCNTGYYLNERPNFTYDPLFHAGCYYVQEAGSMFIDFILNQINFPKNNVKVLDACASPGGKSTLLNSYLSEDSLLVANEIIKSRADTLCYNLSKWGTKNCVVTNNDTNKFKELKNYFDLVLVDAPCSGSGLFRKQATAINEWSLNAVNDCSLRQKDILLNLIDSIKPNGLLIYSTCSYSSEENENITNWLINENDFSLVKIKINKEWGIIETDVGYRFYPHLTASEGFYISVLRKNEGVNNSVTKTKLKENISVNKLEKELLKTIVNIDCPVFKKNTNFYLANENVLDFFERFGKYFYFKKAGVCIGELKNKDIMPNHELALYSHKNEHVNSIELNFEDSIKFLKKENLLIENTSKGLFLATYKNFGIGWCKILPNRVNNYLPSELRILK